MQRLGIDLVTPGGGDDVGDEDRREPPELHRRAWCCGLRPGEQQCRVLAEDRGLEVLELRSGFDPELFDEGRPGGPIRLQGVRLPFGAVEREHQLAARPLAERLLCNEGLELGHELVVAAERRSTSMRSSRALCRSSSRRADLGLRERLVREVGERRAAPQREGFPEDGRRRLLVLHRPSRARLGEKALEASASTVTRSTSSA